MLYLYDDAIAEDLSRSLADDIPIVKVVDSTILTEIVAQAQNDHIRYPLVGLTRGEDISVDQKRLNFTRLHKGVATVIDNKTNNIYKEKMLPIELSYTLTILATNTADCDELLRELLFKFTDMYYLEINLPYEDKRMIRFGIKIDTDSNITRKSGVAEALSEGKLYEVMIPLKCEGCVYVNYVPVKLTNISYSDKIRVE